jgi:5'-3' exonuclease
MATVPGLDPELEPAAVTVPQGWEAEPRLFDLPADGGQVPRVRPAAPAGVARGSVRRRRRQAPLLLAVDGNGLAHRAYHGVGGAGAPPAAAAERVLTMLARVADQTRPTACVIGFDDPVASLRRQLHPAYKSARPPKDDALVELLVALPELLASLGFTVVTPAGLEADDVLGSAAALASARQAACALATGDQDAFALVSPTVQVWYLLGGRIQRVSPSWLRERYGVGPGAYPALAALRGDASDCLPGVKGIGAVTAARLLTAFGDVEAALAAPAAVARLLGSWVAEALVAGHDTYQRNRELMAIRADVPLDVAACNRRLDPRAVAATLRERGLDEALAPRLLGAFGLLGRAAWRLAQPAG